jgi:hypothetical protein
VFSSLLALLVYLVSTSAGWTKRGFTLGQMVMVFVTMFPLGGLLAGLSWPAARRALGAFHVGFLALLPSTIALALIRLPRAEWVPVGVVVGLLSAAIVGGCGGLIIWDDERRS